MNLLTAQKHVSTLDTLVEGSSIYSSARMTGVAGYGSTPPPRP